MTSFDLKFCVVCMKCYMKANRSKLLYEGLVNYDFHILSPTKIDIDYHCLNCGNREWKTVDMLKDQKPKNDVEFKIFRETTRLKDKNKDIIHD